MKDEKILNDLIKKAEKKILDEELMTNEELDQVVGGSHLWTLIFCMH